MFRATLWIILPLTLLYARTDPGTVEIKVVDTSGAIISRAKVQVFDRNNHSAPIINETDANGLLRLDVEPGNYDVLVRSDAFSPWAKELAVDAGQIKKVIVVMRPGSCEVAIACDSFFSVPILRLKTVDEKGSGIPNADVLVINKKTLFVDKGQTDAQGTVVFEVAAGEYRIMAQHDLLHSGERDFRVPYKTKEIEVRITLRTQR